MRLVLEMLMYENISENIKFTNVIRTPNDNNKYEKHNRNSNG